ncbi:MAG: hypothetical protein ACK457_12565, partial [Flavobacteriia bacterium]
SNIDFIVVSGAYQIKCPSPKTLVNSRLSHFKQLVNFPVREFFSIFETPLKVSCNQSAVTGKNKKTG